MKSPTLRCSRGSRKASGSNAPSPSRGIGLAILQGRSSTSNCSIRRAPLLPDSNCRQLCSAPRPSGERSPIPVTTTRLMSWIVSPFWPRERQAGLASGRRLFDVLHRVAYGEDRLGGVIGNLDPEFFLERHHQFNGVEAVRAQIVDEAGLFGHLVGVDAKMLDDDFLDAFCGIAHFEYPRLHQCLVFVSGRLSANQAEKMAVSTAFRPVSTPL